MQPKGRTTPPGAANSPPAPLPFWPALPPPLLGVVAAGDPAAPLKGTAAQGQQQEDSECDQAVSEGNDRKRVTGRGSARLPSAPQRAAGEADWQLCHGKLSRRYGVRAGAGAGRQGACLCAL